jgi:hypothetical protein
MPFSWQCHTYGNTNNAMHARHAARLKPRIDRECKPIIEPLFLPRLSGPWEAKLSQSAAPAAPSVNGILCRLKNVGLHPASAVVGDRPVMVAKDPNFLYGLDTMLS